MNPDNIEEESKSIGSTSSKLFTLSALVQAFSRSIVGHTKPIKNAESDLEAVSERESFVTAFWTKMSNVFGPLWMAAADGTPSERVGYLKERRAEQNVAFTAIFLQALGEFGFRLGELSQWDPESQYIDLVEELGPDQINYVARLDDGEYDPDWQDAMMKPAADDGKYVFNNVADSVTKTYKVLCRLTGVPVQDSSTGLFDEVPDPELEEIN
jgi:hypothetical protein